MIFKFWIVFDFSLEISFLVLVLSAIYKIPYYCSDDKKHDNLFVQKCLTYIGVI
jgi:hypothetical protein